MQENEFEKSVRKKIDELKLVPGGNVWKKVEAEIKREKRKRFVVFFWFAAFIIAVGGGLYFYTTTRTASPTLQLNGGNTSARISANKKIDDLPKTNPKIKADITAGETLHVSNDEKVAIKNGGDDEGESRNKTVASSDRASVNSHNTATRIHTYKEETSIKKSVEAGTDKTGNNSTVTEQPKIKQEDQLSQREIYKTDSIKDDRITKTVIENLKDTVTNIKTENKQSLVKKATQKHKLRIGFTVFAGTSNNLTRLPIFSSLNADYSRNNYPSNGNVGSVSNGNSFLTPLTYKSNFTYGLGIYLMRDISKRINFSAGLNYHFASASSIVGSKVTGQQNLFDSALEKSTTVNEFYSIGNSVQYKNKYSLLELPLNAFIQFNRSKSWKVLFNIGISPGLLVGSDALYANYSKLVYYVEKGQFRKLLLSGQTGFQFTVFNNRLMNITAGPEVEFGFTNMAKTATGTNQHLFSGLIKTNINLK